ncbi:MAG: phage antirepressor [Microbacterium sp.]|nr:phage antirepressor [Microbacterium sp.]
MTGLEVFRFDGAEVRTVVIDGEPWFVLADVVAALGLVRSASAVADRLDDGVRQTYPILDSLGRTQRATVISEPGVYEVAIRSDAPSARTFRTWLTREVIPAIRRTGQYVAPRTVEDQLADAVMLAQGIIAKRDEAIAELTPRAEAWDALADAEGDYSVGDAAKMLARAGIETGPQRLFEYLAGIRWIFRRDGHWCAYADVVDRGMLTHRPQSHRHPRTGAVVLDAPQIRVTVKGLNRLRERIGGRRVALA